MPVNITIDYERPEVVKKYTKQVAFIDAPTRYSVIEATTKAGKTTGCIVWLFEQAIGQAGSFWVNKDGELVENKETQNKDGYNYWWVAPIFSQAKIAYKRMKRFIQPQELFKSNEAELSITLANGAVISFKSGDNADSLYGDDVYAVVIDEATRMKEDSWFAIRSTLTATNGPAKIIGNVKGTNNWVYKIARDAEAGKLPDWSFFKLTAKDAVDAGVLKQSEIDDAERTLPKGIFLELYYAIPFVNSSNKFAFAFDKTKHVSTCTINYDFPIYLSFDFNKNPICCSIVQYYNETVFIPHVIKLENSDIYRLCAHIKNMFTAPGLPEPHFIVNGDASGNNKSAMVKDNLNYFRIIKAELDLSHGQMQQLASNPSIEENQVLVCAVLEHVKHCIDPDNAQPLISDLEFAEMLPDGKLKKADRNDTAQQLDPLDTYRYFINRNLRHFLKGYK
jgi:hypothetical protein